MQKEYILCAAIHYSDYKNDDPEFINSQPRNISAGIVISGHRHHNCIATWFALTKIPTRKPEHQQGFLTSLNRFVDRKEAFLIAKNNGQLLSPNLHDQGNAAGNILTSEDLY